LEHAEKTAGSLPGDTPEQAQAKAVIIKEVDRLHWRIWHGKASDARITLERLDLDHARAALREQLRAERNGDELAELDDLDAGERSRRRLGARRGAHRGASVARGSFCYSLGP